MRLNSVSSARSSGSRRNVPLVACVYQHAFNDQSGVPPALIVALNVLHRAIGIPSTFVSHLASCVVHGEDVGTLKLGRLARLGIRQPSDKSRPTCAGVSQSCQWTGGPPSLGCIGEVVHEYRTRVDCMIILGLMQRTGFKEATLFYFVQRSASETRD